MIKIKSIILWAPRQIAKIPGWAGEKLMNFYLGLEPHSDAESVIFACAAVGIFSFAVYIDFQK